MGSTCGAYSWFRWSARNARSCMRRLTSRSCMGGSAAGADSGARSAEGDGGDLVQLEPLLAAPVWPCGGLNNVSPFKTTVRRT